MSKREDRTWFTHIAVPFKSINARTGKRNRVFWIKVECVVHDSVLRTIAETDTVGYPG